jgi:hypothetical protein
VLDRLATCVSKSDHNLRIPVTTLSLVSVRETLLVWSRRWGFDINAALIVESWRVSELAYSRQWRDICVSHSGVPPPLIVRWECTDTHVAGRSVSEFNNFTNNVRRCADSSLTALPLFNTITRHRRRSDELTVRR